MMYMSRLISDAHRLLEKKRDAIRVINNVIAVLICNKDKTEGEIKSAVPNRREKVLLDELNFAFDTKISSIVERGWQIRNDYFSILSLIKDLTSNPSDFDTSKPNTISRSRCPSSMLQIYDNDDTLFQNLSAELTLEIIYTETDYVGYIKASEALLEDFTYDVHASSSDISVVVLSHCLYDRLLVEFIKCTAVISDIERSPTTRKDFGDSSYVFTFKVLKCSSFLISLQVYGRHIPGSPKFVCVADNIHQIGGYDTDLKSENCIPKIENPKKLIYPSTFELGNGLDNVTASYLERKSASDDQNGFLKATTPQESSCSYTASHFVHVQDRVIRNDPDCRTIVDSYLVNTRNGQNRTLEQETIEQREDVLCGTVHEGEGSRKFSYANSSDLFKKGNQSEMKNDNRTGSDIDVSFIDVVNDQLQHLVITSNTRNGSCALRTRTLSMSDLNLVERQNICSLNVGRRHSSVDILDACSLSVPEGAAYVKLI